MVYQSVQLQGKKRDSIWRKMRRYTAKNMRDYNLARNSYVKIRREEEKNYGKDIIDKCREEPNLF